MNAIPMTTVADALTDGSIGLARFEAAMGQVEEAVTFSRWDGMPTGFEDRVRPFLDQYALEAEAPVRRAASMLGRVGDDDARLQSRALEDAADGIVELHDNVSSAFSSRYMNGALDEIYYTDGGAETMHHAPAQIDSINDAINAALRFAQDAS